MSVHNGDKSRFGRQRKRKIARRQQMRAIRRAAVESRQPKSK